MTLTRISDRLAWVDYAKGVCLVAVVALYAATYVEKASGDAGWMQHWVDFCRPFRMPDFFLIAGLFLSRSIDRPWPVYLDRKVLHFAYFFVVWTSIYFVLRHVVISHPAPEQALWEEYLWWFAEPFHMLWFIAMLPVYFLVTRLLRPVPWPIILAAAALLQIFEPDSGWRQLDRFSERYVYFYVGYLFAPVAFRIAAWAQAQVATALVVLIGWAAINASLVLNDWAALPVVSLVLGLAGSAAVIAIGSLFSLTRVMEWLRYLGQNSIVVFLAFFPVTLIGAKGLARFGLIDDTGTQVLIVTVASVVLPVLFYRATRGTPLCYLFERPAWARLTTAPRAAVVAQSSPSKL